MKKLFVAATRQNDGKTMTSVGLFNAFQERYPKICYMKPVGQHYKLVDNEKIDKDAILFHHVYNLNDPLKLMSPLAVPKGFTEAYIKRPNLKKLENAISTSFDQLSEGKDFALIEGTGHAGVGAVFDLSNGHTAKLLGAKVILVSLGGIGRSIDEIMLNKACFETQGIEIAGVIVNKIREDKYKKVSKIVRKGLERQGVRVFGCIPYVNELTTPNVAEVCENTNAELLSGEEYLNNTVEKFIIGDMFLHEAFKHFKKGRLLIVPTDREGLYMTAICRSILQPGTNALAGIIFSGARKPHSSVLNLIQKADLPLMYLAEDSFTIASKINQMLVKVRSEESEKIKTMQNLVKEYVDIDHICKAL